MESEDVDVLEATDPDFIDRINDGPHEPRKLVPAAVVDGITVPEHYVAKDKFEWTSEEKIDVLKDAKVKNILHNSLDEVLSNRVITCKKPRKSGMLLRFNAKEPKP